MFLESILIWKNFTKIQKCATLHFGDLPWVTSLKLKLRAQLEGFATHWRVKIPIVKKTSNFFSKSGFKDFWRLILATHSRVASSTRGFCDSLASESPSREKDLEKFFKIWIQGILATHLATYSQVSWVAKNACFAKIGLKIRQFQNFSVSLASGACLFVFSASPSLKTIFFTSKTFIFLFNLHAKSKKRYEFSLLFTLFKV